MILKKNVLKFSISMIIHELKGDKKNKRERIGILEKENFHLKSDSWFSRIFFSFFFFVF